MNSLAWLNATVVAALGGRFPSRTQQKQQFCLQQGLTEETVCFLATCASSRGMSNSEASGGLPTQSQGLVLCCLSPEELVPSRFPQTNPRDKHSIYVFLYAFNDLYQDTQPLPRLCLFKVTTM